MREALWQITIGSGMMALTLFGGFVATATDPGYKPTGLHYPRTFHLEYCHPCN